MTNQEKYDEAFRQTFGLDQEDELTDLSYQSIEEWDSVGHMALMSELEERFEIELEIDDIIDFASHAEGHEILRRYNIEL